ncbi:M48 family metallopeptidase, partial [Psychrilyobacter sp. S5]|uniref:tetratricopeptide repeat protein n=2 Tax=Fusobacteriaceae TaxID=203492 RepID=UPI002175DA4E
MLRTAIFMEINEIENLDERRVDLRSELIFNPDNRMALRELGAILCFQKKTDDAIEIYKKMLKLDPKNGEYMAYMGYLYYEKDDFPEAIKLFNKALDADPEAAFVYFLLGNAYSRIGRIVDAVRAYDLAIFLDFDIYDAHV